MSTEPEDDLAQLIDQRAEIDRRLLEQHSREMAILFSDIVGSTTIFEKKGDIAGLAMVRRHNGILFPVVERHDGRVVKTIGDAILAVFEDPAQGVRCAAEMQRALAQARAPDDAIAIHIRVGVHAGRVMLDGGDVFGDAVNTAARIVGKAGSDEVLLSKALFDQVSGTLAFAADGREPVALKGKAEPMPLVALRWRTDGAPSTPGPGAPDEPLELVTLEIGLGPNGLKESIVDGPEDEGPLRSYAELPIQRTALDAFAARFGAFLGGEAPAYLEALKQLGRELFDSALSDRAHRALLSTSRTHLRLQVDDALARIPWELMHDGRDHLALSFAVGRVVSARGDDAPAVGHLPDDAHALVISDPLGDLPAARNEGGVVERLLRGGYRGPVRHLQGPISRQALLEALPGCRLLHFAGHAIRATANGVGGLQLADGQLTADEMRKAMGGSAPELVFANGCHASGVRGFSDAAARTSDLAAGLLMQGVRHFVGPMGEIPDEDALTFALRFYESAFDGHTLGEAVRHARGALAADESGRLSFGRYLLYGDPRGKLDAKRSPHPVTRARSWPPIPAVAASPGASTPARPAPSPLRASEPPAPSPAASAQSGRPMRTVLAVAGAAVVLGAIGVVWMGHRGGRPSSPSAPVATTGRVGTAHARTGPDTPKLATTTPAAKSPHPAPVVHSGPICVAMLPFKNFTGDAKLDFLGGGLMEAVLTDLGGQHGLHVIEHDQIQADLDYMKFTNDARVSDPKTRAALGKITGCETVLLGGYQKWNGKIRATARIIQVETGAVLVAVKVDRPASKVFQLQDAVAKSLHGELPVLRKALRP